MVDDAGKKFVLRAARRMLEVGGLGVVDGQALCDASFGDEMTIGQRRFVLLRPSVRDLLGIIERKAQIMIPKDSFLVPMYLDISSGSRVIEGGVGSGALTIVLLRTVAPDGKVISYDNRKDHSDLARKNIALTGLERCWEFRLEDVCTTDLVNDVDAAVVDIPNPWDAIENIKKSLRVGGHICCYVPNCEPAGRTCQEDEGFRLRGSVLFRNHPARDDSPRRRRQTELRHVGSHRLPDFRKEDGEDLTERTAKPITSKYPLHILSIR